MAGAVFERIEKKYCLNKAQYENVLREVLKRMQLDEYKKSTIMSMYFDTDDDALIRASAAVPQPVYKEKFRIRSYGVPGRDSKVFLELKKKLDGVVYKRREALTVTDAEDFLSGNFPEEKMTQILKEIRYFIDHYKIKPKILISYERSAYFMKNGEPLRVTFDENIRARRDKLNMRLGTEGELLQTEPLIIMEVKADQAIPLWLVDILSENHVYHSRFSKYASFYHKKLRGE